MTMNCSRFRFLIQQRFDMDLSPQDDRMVSQHLESCELCDRFHHQIDQVALAALDVPLPEECLPENPDFQEALAGKIMKEVPQEKPGFLASIKNLFGGGKKDKEGKQQDPAKAQGQQGKQGGGISFPHISRGKVADAEEDMAPAPRKKKPSDLEQDELLATSTRLKSLSKIQPQQADDQPITSGGSLGKKFGVDVPQRKSASNMEESQPSLAESIRRQVHEQNRPPEASGWPDEQNTPALDSAFGGAPTSIDSAFGAPTGPGQGTTPPGWSAPANMSPPTGSGAWGSPQQSGQQPAAWGQPADDWGAEPDTSSGGWAPQAESVPPARGAAEQANAGGWGAGWGSAPESTQPTGTTGWGGEPAPPLQDTGWGVEPAAPLHGAGGWGAQPSTPPVQAEGGWGAAPEPQAPPSQGGWGATLEPSASPSQGGWGATPEPSASPSQGGWGATPEPSASPSQGGWGATPPAPASEGGWGAASEPSAPPSQGGWGATPPTPASQGGWGAAPATGGNDDWGAEPATPKAQSGWGAQSPAAQSGSWGAQAAPTSAGDGWGDEPAESWGAPSSGGGWGARPEAQQSNEWDSSPSAPANDWGAGPAAVAPQPTAQQSDSWGAPAPGWDASAQTPSAPTDNWNAPASSEWGTPADEWGAPQTAKPQAAPPKDEWGSSGGSDWGHPQPASAADEWGTPATPAPQQAKAETGWGDNEWGSPPKPDEWGTPTKPAPIADNSWGAPQPKQDEWGTPAPVADEWGVTEPASATAAPTPPKIPTAPQTPAWDTAPKAPGDSDWGADSWGSPSAGSDAWSEEGEQIQTGMWKAFSLEESGLGPSQAKRAGGPSNVVPPAPPAAQDYELSIQERIAKQKPATPVTPPAAPALDQFNVPVQQRAPGEPMMDRLSNILGESEAQSMQAKPATPAPRPVVPPTPTVAQQPSAPPPPKPPAPATPQPANPMIRPVAARDTAPGSGIRPPGVTPIPPPGVRPPGPPSGKPPAPGGRPPMPGAPGPIAAAPAEGMMKKLDDRDIDKIFKKLGVKEGDTSGQVNAGAEAPSVPPSPVPPQQVGPSSVRPVGGAPVPGAPRPGMPPIPQAPGQAGMPPKPGIQPPMPSKPMGGAAPMASSVPGHPPVPPVPGAPRPAAVTPPAPQQAVPPVPAVSKPVIQPKAPPQPAAQSSSGIFRNIDDQAVDKIFDNLTNKDAAKAQPAQPARPAADAAVPPRTSGPAPKINVREAVQSIRSVAQESGAMPPPPKIAGIGRLDTKIDAQQEVASGKISSIGKFLLDQQDQAQLGKLGQSELADGRFRVLTIEAAEEIYKLLNHIAAQPGVVGSCIVGHDGIPIANNMPQEYDPESVGAWSLGVYVNTTNVIKRMGHNHLHQLVAKSHFGYLIIADFGGGILVTVSSGQQTEHLIPLMRSITQLVAQ